MDIACPNCAATYRVPDSLIAGGQALRCAACDHEWVPVAVPSAAMPVSVPGMAASSMPAPPAIPTEFAPTQAVPPELVPPELVPPELAPPEPKPAEPRQAVPVPEALAEARRPAPARAALPTAPPPLQRRTAPKPGEARTPRTRRLAWALPTAWLISVTFVLLALFGLVLFGEAIALAWPPFARVTSLLTG